MKELQTLLAKMEPASVVSILAPALKNALAHLDEEDRVAFITEMVEDSPGDKITSMVHL